MRNLILLLSVIFAVAVSSQNINIAELQVVDNGKVIKLHTWVIEDDDIAAQCPLVVAFLNEKTANELLEKHIEQAKRTFELMEELALSVDPSKGEYYQMTVREAEQNVRNLQAIKLNPEFRLECDSFDLSNTDFYRIMDKEKLRKLRKGN